MPRSHDATCCQTGCQTGLTTGYIVYTAGCQTGCTTRFVKPVVQHGLTSVERTVAVRSTRLNEQWLFLQHGCQTGLTTGLTTGCIV